MFDISHMAATPPSTPPSPLISELVEANNSLSDVFSDSPPATPAETDIASEIPRLRSTHATAGYRDGISKSKVTALQPGFDEGYSLGAVFGLKVGYILGILEGLWSAYHIPGEQKDHFRSLHREACKQLKLEKLFSQEFWDKDGTWTYKVTGQGEVPSFQEVAEQHPVVIRWDQAGRDDVNNVGLDLKRFVGDEWEAGRT